MIDQPGTPHTSHNGAAGGRGHRPHQGGHLADRSAHSATEGPNLAHLADLLEEAAFVCRELVQNSPNGLAESNQPGLMSNVNGQAIERREARVGVISDPLLSANEVGDLLGIDARTVRRWRQQNKLPAAIDLGGVWRWKASSIRAWLEERQS